MATLPPTVYCLLCKKHKEREAFYASSLTNSTYRCKACVRLDNRSYWARRADHPGYRLLTSLRRSEKKANGTGRHNISRHDVSRDDLLHFVKTQAQCVSSVTGLTHPLADLVVVRRDVTLPFDLATNAAVMTHLEARRHFSELFASLKKVKTPNKPQQPVVSPAKVRIPKKHKEPLPEPLKDLIAMFNGLTEHTVLNQIVTPQVYFIVDRLVQKANGVRVHKEDWKLITLALVRHLSQLPKEDHVEFLQHVYAFTDYVPCISPASLLEKCRRVRMETDVKPLLRALFKNFKKVISVIFCALCLKAEQMPLDLDPYNFADFNEEKFLLYRKARSFLIENESVVVFQLNWNDNSETTTKRKLDQGSCQSHKRAKTLSAS